MNCTKCGTPTEVIDTEKFSMYVWRRRRCLKCNYRMNTHENFVDDTKVARTKAPKEKQPVPKEQPTAEVQPLPVRNTRKQIEDIKEYLEYRRKAGEE